MPGFFPRRERNAVFFPVTEDMKILKPLETDYAQAYTAGAGGICSRTHATLGTVRGRGPKRLQPLAETKREGLAQ